MNDHHGYDKLLRRLTNLLYPTKALVIAIDYRSVCFLLQRYSEREREKAWEEQVRQEDVGERDRKTGSAGWEMKKEKEQDSCESSSRSPFIFLATRLHFLKSAQTHTSTRIIFDGHPYIRF